MELSMNRNKGKKREFNYQEQLGIKPLQIYNDLTSDLFGLASELSKWYVLGCDWELLSLPLGVFLSFVYSKYIFL